MVKIDTEGFAEKMAEYLRNPACFSIEAVEATLNLEDPNKRHRIGVRFGHNTELVMRLFARAYQRLDNKINEDEFSHKVAKSIERFAEPFRQEDNLCYPHFLLHGISLPTLEGVVDKIQNNSRIIHETQIVKKSYLGLDKYGLEDLGEIVTGFDSGETDDFFGICHFLSSKEQKYYAGTYGYIAKASFFVDTSERELYVITIQGRRYEALGYNNMKTERVKEGEQLYAKIGNLVGMSPRRFILLKVMDFARENGYRKIKVIKPTEHPMFIENHRGFLGNYESVIRKAGIQEDAGCYLESSL